MLRNPLGHWLGLLLIAGLVFTVFRGFFQARKIQPNGFRWRTFRNEILFGVANLTVSSIVLGGLTVFLNNHRFIKFNPAPASWWVIAFEYAVYFFVYDAYFYWVHRAMHLPRIYRWLHKIHHFSTAPNVLTTVSLNPAESVINGLIIPIFTAVFPLHAATMVFIGPTNIVLGAYVHSGYEFLPRWWNKSWLTKWFITATFHDQHHKYFNYNFGGFTTLWDWICGTVRPKYEADFDALKARLG
jgi:lathosterol oxidase